MDLDLSHCCDIMVDIETTGLEPEHSAIIQLAAVRFDLKTQAVDSTKMFCKSLLIPPNRFWNEGTRQWWGQQKVQVFSQIMATMEDPKTVMRAFADWCGYSNPFDLKFWAKPISFDYTFVDSYFKTFEVANPFHFRNAVDMNSFLRGMVRDTTIPQTTAIMSGDAHHALHDVIHQIDVVFHAMNGEYVNAQAPACLPAPDVVDLPASAVGD